MLDQRTSLAMLRAVAEPTRLRVLALLLGGELSVKDITRILGQSQPRISQHLRQLCDSGLVERFRDGHFVYYRVPARGADLRSRHASRRRVVG